MKTLKKVLGIIAMIAIIGMFFSCGEASEEDQTRITITDIPEQLNGLYAQVAVAKAIDGKELVSAGFYREIADGGVTGAQRDDKEAVVTKEGYVVIIISTDTSNGEDVFVGVTEGLVTLGKGEYTVSADKFLDKNQKGIAAAAANYKGAPSASAFGTYTCYTNLATAPTAVQSESINFSKTSFEIFDSTGDTFTFTIEKWENAATPSDITGLTSLATDYPKGYKFTGKITSAKEGGTVISKDDTTSSGSKGYFGSNQTAPGIYPKDMKDGTTIWMYLYAKETSGVITEFVRSSFNKDAANDSKKPIPTSATAASGLRVYKKL